MIHIILGSKSDLHVGDRTKKILEQFGIEYKISIASAHRAPDFLRNLVESSDSEIFIAIAGLSAALPGMIAAYTTKPVIGVPVSSKVNLDSILSILQMPPGIPVATVGLDNGENAALLAVEILTLKHPALREKLGRYREKLKEWMLEDSENLMVKDIER
jgi:5-(carboxyamino)imidazole ribonucleotide mutase